jgi:hypothetical protein
MEQEVRAVESTKAMLDKAGILPASARREMEEGGRDRYLGPQIHVAWGEDRLKPAAATLGPDEGDESPTEEVMSIINKRRGIDGGVGGGEDTDTTEAYLRSSFAGALHSKPPIVTMRKPTRHDARVLEGERELTAEERMRDYLPTQVHQEWGVGEKAKALKMDIIPGRESKRVHSKGIIEVSQFHEAARPQSGSLGPGAYDTSAGMRFGENVKGGALDFDLHAARDDVVGPNGERPIAAARYDQYDIDEEGRLGYKEEVIVDAQLAKEGLLRRQQAPKLYVQVRSSYFFILHLNKLQQDRHEPPKKVDPGQASLGGQWFTGMADEVKKQKNVVQYSTMAGRGWEEEAALNELGSLMGPRDGDEVDLEIEDWKPHLPTETSGPSWMDPKKDPRFGKPKKADKVEDAPPSPTPNYEYIKPREGVGVLNMGNLRDRWADDKASEDDQLLREEMGYGVAEKNAARRDAQEEDEAKRRGSEMESGKKRISYYVNMDKQSTRPENRVQTSAPDVVYNIEDEAVKSRRDKGAISWDLQAGRELKVITKEKVASGGVLPEELDEEVIISPNLDRRSR